MSKKVSVALEVPLMVYLSAKGLAFKWKMQEAWLKESFGYKTLGNLSQRLNCANVIGQIKWQTVTNKIRSI